MKYIAIAFLATMFISTSTHATEYIDASKTEFKGYFGCFATKEEGSDHTTKSIINNCNNYGMDYKLIPEKSYVDICKDGFEFVITYTCKKRVK